MITIKKMNSLNFHIKLGIGLGLLLCILTMASNTTTLPIYWIGLFGFCLSLACMHSKQPAIKTILFCLLTSFLIAEIWSSCTSALESFVLVASATYAINAYNIAYLQSGYPFSYKHLFHAVWDTAVKLFIVCIITMLASSMIGLTVMLSLTLNIDVIANVLSISGVSIGILYGFSIIGLYIANQSDNMIKQLRLILLSACKLFLPILSIISVLYIVGLIASMATGSNYKPDYTIYASVTLLGILFVNGVFQLGEDSKPYNKALTYIVNTFIPFIAVYPILAIISLYSKTTPPISALKDGLNQSNFSTLLMLTMCVLYGACYTIVLIRREAKWMRSLKSANIYLGYILAGLVLLTNNYFFAHSTLNPNTHPANFANPALAEKLKQTPSRNEAIKQAGFDWVKPDGDKTKFVTAAYFKNKPVHVCKFKTEEVEYVGTVRGNRCMANADYQLWESKTFLVFSGPADNVLWRRDILPYPSASGIIAILTSSGAVCRGIYKNRVFIGESNHFKCQIIDDNNQPVQIRPYQYLNIKAKSTTNRSAEEQLR